MFSTEKISILMKHISTYMHKKSLQMQTTHGYFLFCLYLVVCFIFICSPFFSLSLLWTSLLIRCEFFFAFLSLLVELANSLARFTWNISYSYWNTLPEYGMASQFDYGFSDFHKNHATNSHITNIQFRFELSMIWSDDEQMIRQNVQIKCG